MRCYISVTPAEIQEYLNLGSLVVPFGMTVTQVRSDENPEADEEELEFDLSFIAAQDSKLRQAAPAARGFALALEVPTIETGLMNEVGVQLLKPLSWSYVQAILVSDSEESELSWFAPQEVQGQLDSWLS